MGCQRCGRTHQQANGGLIRLPIYPKKWNKNSGTAFPKKIREDTVLLCSHPCAERVTRMICRREKGRRLMPHVYKGLVESILRAARERREKPIYHQ